MLENFVPELKSVVPDLPASETWTVIDRNLPNLNGLHKAEDLQILRVEGDIGSIENDDSKATIEALEAERKELRNKVLILDKRVSGLKIDLNLMKEKVEEVQ